MRLASQSQSADYPMQQLYFPFTLRLYAHVLRSLRDHNFTGLDLFYRVKDCWKERDTPTTFS